jgi:hypothetical protein
MKKMTYRDWVDLRWQRPLTPEELSHWHSFLEDHPEHIIHWDADRQLLESVKGLIDLPISNHFTSKVMREIEQLHTEVKSPQSAHDMSPQTWWSLLWGMPGIRVSGFIALLLFGFFLWQWDPSKPNLAQSVTAVTESQMVPTVEELEHFDAIHGLAQATPEVDWELVFAME